MDKKLEDMARRVASTVRTAGVIEFKRDSGPVRRDLRVKSFEWDPEVHKNLSKILWSVERSHSYAVSSLRLFSKLPSSKVSPDGLLGGVGYIQTIKDMRVSLANAVEALSSFSDTLHDEVNGEHWGESDTSESDPIVEDAENVKTNSDEIVEKEFGDEFNGSGFEVENPSPEVMNPSVTGVNEEAAPEEVGDDGFAQLSSKLDKYSKNFKKVIKAQVAKVANSSLPLSTLPGPRIEHLGPGDNEESYGSDDPAGEGLGSGTNTNHPLYEDYCADGVSDYDNVTDGDNSVLKVSTEVYSLLPGSDNKKNLDYYKLGASEEEVDYMMNNDDPEIFGAKRKQVTKDNSLWSKR